MRTFLLRGGVWVLGQIVLLSAIVFLGLWFPGAWGAPAWFSAVVVGLLGVGLYFLVFGLIALGRFLTIFPEPLESSELVVTGVYSVVRHPLYTSVVFCALAWSLWWNSVPALLAWAITVVFLDAKARSEEVRLREKFSSYGAYADKVKRIIPWVY